MARRMKTKEQITDEYFRILEEFRHVNSYSGPSPDGGKHVLQLQAMLLALRWVVGQEKDSPSSKFVKR